MTAARAAESIAALREGRFRWFIAAKLLASHANQMDHLVRGWLVYSLSGSVSLVGLVAAAKSVPLLLVGLLGGILADRVDRRLLLVCSSLCIALTHLTTLGLVVAGVIEIWHLVLLTLLVGVASSVQAPTRYAVLSGTVSRRNLQNAVVFNNGASNVAQSAGPAVGGAVIAAYGFEAAFGLQAALMVAAALATTQIDLVARASGGQDAESFAQAAKNGFAYVRRNRVVLTLVLVGLVPMLLVQPFQHLLPAAVPELLGVGPTETGVLLGAAGIGSFCSLLVLVFLRTPRRPGLLMLLAVVGYGASVALFAVLSTFWVALAAVWGFGVCRGVYRTLNHTLLIANTEDAYLGRVNSIYALDRGVVPLGLLVVGGAGDLFGIGPTFVVSGLLCVALGVVVLGMARTLRVGGRV